MTKEENTALVKEKLLKALEESLGIITIACKKCNIARSSFYNYVKNDKDFEAKVKELEYVALDFAEHQLLQQMKDGSTSATIFFLKCKGKARGYTETIQNDGKLTIEVKRVDE